MTQFDWNYEKYLKDNTNNSIKRKTAVEWLIEQLVELDKQLDGKRKSDDSTVIKFNPTKIYEQAKQIEKEQIIKAHGDKGWAKPTIDDNGIPQQKLQHKRPQKLPFQAAHLNHDL